MDIEVFPPPACSDSLRTLAVPVPVRHQVHPLDLGQQVPTIRLLRHFLHPSVIVHRIPTLRLNMGIYTNTSEISRHTVSNTKLVPDPAHLGSGEVSGLSGIEASKQLAAWTAVDRHIKPEHRVSYSGLQKA
jgi:hypothetical protein